MPRELASAQLKDIESPRGRFGRLFRLEPASFPPEDLWALAQALTRPLQRLKDGPDPQESHIPAAYTYFAQFVDHDQTFDPSTLQQQKQDVQAIIDFRTPRLDLDNMYGRGPVDQPYLYGGRKFLLGDKLAAVMRNSHAVDLPRSTPDENGVRRAIIGDPRNDENVIVSQLHGMFLRFHNLLAEGNPRMRFEEVQQQMRWHYQWLVVHDLLPRIVQPSVLDAISPAIRDPQQSFGRYPPVLRYYKSYKMYDGAYSGFMPVEYSVAAYRLGHSMVRPGYRVNERTPPLSILDAGNPNNGLNAFREFPRAWTIDWHRFIDIDTPPRNGDADRVQFAFRIDTSVVEPLAALPVSIAGEESLENKRLMNLAFRSLLRGSMLQLPSGQDVARAMDAPPLPEETLLIGPAETGTTETERARPIREVSRAFIGKCPLWVYVLAEARHNFYEHGQAVLGPVGGRIIAEVMLGLMQSDGSSILHNPGWRPNAGKDSRFALADLLALALRA
jgi:hypothetical protein